MEFFAIIFFFYNVSEGTLWRIFSRWVKVHWVKILAPEVLYFRTYSLFKIGFWNHPELIHHGIFVIKKKL
jgi:hypothetical protein